MDPRWPDHFREMAEMIDSFGLTEQVHILGAVPRAAQIGLMREAVAVIQPSRFEGWSTVVEEARALGSRLLLSSFPVHLEQSPPRTSFFSPDSPSELAELMRQAWRDAPQHCARQVTDHDRYVQNCARGLIAMARRARSAYRARYHDPKVIMRDLLRPDRRTAEDETGRKLRERVVAGCRAALRADPQQLAAFQRLCGSNDRIHAEVIAPAIARLSEADRARFLAAGGRTTQPRSTLRTVSNFLRPRW